MSPTSLSSPRTEGFCLRVREGVWVYRKKAIYKMTLAFIHKFINSFNTCLSLQRLNSKATWLPPPRRISHPCCAPVLERREVQYISKIQRISNTDTKKNKAKRGDKGCQVVKVFYLSMLNRVVGRPHWQEAVEQRSNESEGQVVWITVGSVTQSEETASAKALRQRRI